HPLVIEAALRHALLHHTPMVLFEATCNQVNQDGGYTGMRPAGFVEFVHAVADQVGLPRSRIVFGGDHLGPNPWPGLVADAAMDKAEAMVDAYVAAGFHKIHLDCSMACADDPVPLPEAEIVRRAVRLCLAAEAACKRTGGIPPVYVIGTEVPTPGGATEAIEGLAVTTPEAALATIAAHRQAFEEAGLAAAWERVIASVVQPGVEFDHHEVIDYRPEKAGDLSGAIESVSGLVFEAHSTDYQTRASLWALDAIENEWIPSHRRAGLRAVTLERMHEKPAQWRRYYRAEGQALQIDMQYSLSDRIRYYWPDPVVESARERLFANLGEQPPPMPLLSQYLPDALPLLRSGAARDPKAWVVAHVMTVLDDYHDACTSN